MTFSLSFPSGGHMEFKQGERISVEFSDGKGVSARIADVSIGPGGTPFSIICTEDGSSPLTQRDHATLAYHGGTAVVGDAELREAQMLSDEAGEGDGHSDPEEADADLRGRLSRAERDLERYREMHVAQVRTIQELSGRRQEGDLAQSLMEQLQVTEAARAEWERNCRNWEGQYHTVEEMTIQPLARERDEMRARALSAEDEIRRLREERETLRAGTALADFIAPRAPSVGPETFTFQTEEVPVPQVREAFQVESPRPRVRVSYGQDGTVTLEIGGTE